MNLPQVRILATVLDAPDPPTLGEFYARRGCPTSTSQSTTSR
jgi:hypothetical protein